MRTLTSFVILASSLAACGDKGSGGPDGPIIVPDSPPDAPPDSPPPPDAPSADLSCMGMPDPTTAIDPIVATGTTQEITMNGPAAKADVIVDTFKLGVANRVDRTTSDATGAFTTGNLVTGGVPFDGFLEGTATTTGGAVDPAYRRTFVFPPTPLAANPPSVPVVMISEQTLSLLSIIGAPSQDDTNSGMLFIIVTDCANTPQAGATLSVKQNNTEVGQPFDLSAVSAQAQGIFLVMNVPDGDVEVNATVDGKTYRKHTVKAFKKGGNPATGSTTTTVIRPGP